MVLLFSCEEAGTVSVISTPRTPSADFFSEPVFCDADRCMCLLELSRRDISEAAHGWSRVPPLVLGRIGSEIPPPRGCVAYPACVFTVVLVHAHR